MQINGYLPGREQGTRQIPAQLIVKVTRIVETVDLVARVPLKKAAKIAKGSSSPLANKVGKITRAQLKEIAEIKKTSAKDIQEITKKELWLMGIVLYWRERLLSGNENDLRKGVKFSSSDPYLIKLFLKWLFDRQNKIQLIT